MGQYTIQITTGKDAYIRYTWSNRYGLLDYVKVGAKVENPTLYGLVCFPVDVPSGKNIKSAKFKFKCKESDISQNAAVCEWKIYTIRSDWQEATVDGTMADGLQGDYIKTIEYWPQVNVWEEIDITDTVKTWYSGAVNYGFMIMHAYANAYFSFHSLQASTDRPYLEIVYEDTSPIKPINLVPNAEVKIVSEVIRFSWLFDSAPGDIQNKFDLQWSSNGGATWNTITQTTSNNYYDMPANALPAGNIIWRVRTYSPKGTSEYSDQVAFTAAGKPDTPVLTKPNATENTSRPLIAWTASGQVMYQAQVMQGSNVAWDSGEVASTSDQVQVGINLADNTSYTAKVRVKNQYDLWSDWASKAFTVDFELPNKPSFNIVKDLVRASIRLTIANPTPDGAGGFAHNDIYRRKVNGTWIRIATGIERDGIYEDCAMASSQPYEYMIRTIGTFGYMDSDIKYADIRVRNSQLASISDKDICVPLIYNPQRNISLGMGRTLMQFAGRKKPVAEFSEHVDFGLALSFVVKDIEDIDTLMALVESAETLLYRDNRGRKIYCTIGSLDIDEERKYWTVSFAIAEVSHQEGV